MLRTKQLGEEGRPFAKTSASSSGSVLLEELVLGKRGLGAEYQFDRDTLEVKENHLGIRGIFTRQKMAPGTEIISVPISNGSLTPFRAFEAAKKLLAKLGADRFNVPDSFAIACAMYERITSSPVVDDDLLITSSDMMACYSGSPMTSFGSLARAELLSGNNRAELDSARAIDDHINRLGVDPDLFRSLLAYVTSRYWKNAGVIPVLDWFNASYSEATNCEFHSHNGRFSYFTTRTVECGEEFLWNYNDATAVATWFNYGYVDHERPTLAYLEVELEEGRRRSLEDFAERQLSYPPHKINPVSKIDMCLFQSKLSCPGDQDGLADIHRSIVNAVNSFVNARTWFRTLVLSGQTHVDTKVARAALQTDVPMFGLETELEVIALMKKALATGISQTRARGERFMLSEVGRNIDLAPYFNMAETAHAEWTQVFNVIEAFCAEHVFDDALLVLARRFHTEVSTADGLLKYLTEEEARKPSLLGTLALRYVKGRLRSLRLEAQ